MWWAGETCLGPLSLFPSLENEKLNLPQRTIPQSTRHTSRGSTDDDRPRIHHPDKAGKGTDLAPLQPKPTEIDPLAISVSKSPHSSACSPGFSRALAGPDLEGSPRCMQLLRMTTSTSEFCCLLIIVIRRRIYSNFLLIWLHMVIHLPIQYLTQLLRSNT